MTHNPGQESDVSHLLQCLLLQQVIEHLLAGKHQSRHPHPGLVSLRDSPAVIVHFFQRSGPSTHLPHLLDIKDDLNPVLLTIYFKHMIGG